MSFHKQLWLFWTARSTVFWGIFHWLRGSPTFTWTCFSPFKADFTPVVFSEIFNWLRDSPTFAWAYFSPSKAGFAPMKHAVTVCPHYLASISRCRMLSQNREICYYVPPARKLVFSLQLTVAQCSILRYRGIKCKNWTAHALIAMQRSTICFFFFVQR